uniref:Uncharacterized protein n=2 Tax=Lotharella globosa TaxID=91324 RepID=A0A7S3YRY4_9EUKA|mmetsp:Transcript_9505/g.18592  ORF Transcript_9505/g.18592 Transcript_9505/m.18592 type:complete len:384 (-) Transcript_9505:73-1224(-)
MPSDSGVTDKLTQQLTGGLQAKSDSEFEELKFFAALPKEKGSGLPDPQKPLGEIYLEVRSYAAEGAGLAKMAKSYLEPAMSGATIARWTIVDEDVDSMLERSEDAHIFSVEGMQRLIHRIKNLTKGAPLLLRPPWSLGTLVWLYKASFRTDSTNWPWLVWYLFALQGISLWWTRTIDIIVWEHEVKKGPSKTVFEYGAMIRKILRILGAYQYKAELVVSTLERVKNALSLSDPFASTLLYTFLFLFASLAQFILSFLPSGLGIFLLGFSILFPPWIKVYKDYKYGKNRKKKKDWIDMLIRELRTRFENFLNHVPDENELNHRHICKMQEIKEEKLPKEKSAPVPVEPKAGGAAAAPAAARGDDRKRNDPLDLARPASTPVESI